MRDGGIGVLLGLLLGIVGVWLTRFEQDARGVVYTPSRWPALLLTTLVALRLLTGVWMAAWHLTGHAREAWAAWLQAGASCAR